MKKVISLLALLFLLSACGGVANVDLDTLQTEEVQVGKLNAFVGGTGTVRASQSAILIWQVNGQVEDVNFEVGDEVKEGDVLANLLRTSLPQNVILAKGDLDSAKKELEAFYDSYDEIGIAEAEKKLAEAQDAVKDAEIRLNNLKYTASKEDIDAAFADLVIAEDRLVKARNFFKQFEDRPATDVQRASALTAMNQAQNAYDSALRTYNYMKGTADDIEISKAEAELTIAKLQLIDAQEEYDEVLEGPTEEDISIAESRVAAAQATLDLGVLKAPFDGVVTQAAVKEGDLVTSGQVGFRVDNLDNMYIDVSISEIDINPVFVGQDVELVFDAILAKEYAGKVTDVAIVGENVQGIVSYQVTIKLTDPDELVKTGMTAAVNIVVSELDDVVLVPNRAVRVRDGNRVVYVIKNGKLEPIQIILGASSDIYSEVLDGELEPGDEVVLNPPAVFEPGPPGGRGGP